MFDIYSPRGAGSKSTCTLGLASLAGTALAAAINASTPAGAESLVEQVVDTRLVLAFRVDPADLQKLVPGPWDIADTAAGPAKNANFNVIFYDRMLQRDGAGASIGSPYRFIVFASVMQPKGALAAVSVVSRIYAGDPKRVPGPYKNSLLSVVERHSVIDSASSERGTVAETWGVRAPDHAINLSLKYEKSTPVRQKSEGRVYSSVDTAFYRIYRWDLLAEVAKSAPAGVDRISAQCERSRLRQPIQERPTGGDHLTAYVRAECVAAIAMHAALRIGEEKSHVRHETAGVHHVSWRHGGRLAARGASTAGGAGATHRRAHGHQRG